MFRTHQANIARSLVRVRTRTHFAQAATAGSPVLVGLLVAAILAPAGHGAEPADRSSIRLPSTVLSLNLDDDKIRQSANPDWLEFFDPRNDEKIAAAFQVELTDGLRGKGLSFNGKTSHVNTNVPLADVKTVAFWLNPRALDEPFYLLNFHVSKTGFSVSSPGDGKKLMLSWFANEKWHGVTFDHGLQVNRWQHVLLSIDWAAGQMLYAVDGDLKEPVKFPSVEKRFEGKLAISAAWQDKSLDGVIDDIQVSSATTSDRDVEGLFDAPGKTARDLAGPSAKASIPEAKLLAPPDASIVSSRDRLLAYLKQLLTQVVNEEKNDYFRKEAIREVAAQIAKSGRERDALEALDLIRSTSFHREYDKLRCDVARSAAESGDIALAVRLGHGLESNLNSRVITSIGLAQLRAGQRSSALTTARKAFESLNPEEAVVFRFAAEDVAYLLARLGQHETALSLVNRFDPPNVFITARIVQGAAEGKMLDAAESIIPSLEDRIFIGIAAESLAKAYAQDGQFERAVRTIDRMYDDPPLLLPHKLRTLGHVAGAYKQAGKTGAASALIREAESLSDQDIPRLRDVAASSLAGAYLASDELDKAVALAKKLEDRLGRKGEPEGFLSRHGFVSILAQVAIEQSRSRNEPAATDALQLAEKFFFADESEESPGLAKQNALRDLGRAYAECLGSEGAAARCARLPSLWRLYAMLGMIEARKRTKD